MNGILASIRHQTTDANYHILESIRKVYNRVLNQAIRKDKIGYYLAC